MERTCQKIILEMLKYQYGNTSFKTLEQLYDEEFDKDMMELSDRLQIGGFLFRLFQRGEMQNFISKELMIHVEQDAKRISMGNQFLEVHGVNLVKSFLENQIPVIWFKGNPNLQWIYSDYMTRSTSDLDFLIRKEDRRKAAALMKTQGFSYPQESMDEKGVVFEEEELANWFHEMHYVKRTPVIPLNLDLHLDLTGFPQGTIPKTLYHLDDKDWFDHPDQMQIQEEQIPVLRREDAFMQMIVHYSIHHSFCGLKWLIDLCEVMVNRQEDLDWTYLKETYNHPNERKLMGICFRMVEEITGVERFGGERWQAYWTTRNTDYEYSIYRSFGFEHTKGWRQKVQGRLAKILIPVTAKDRMKMAYYYFGSGQAFVQRTGLKPGGNPIRHIAAALKLFFEDRSKRRQ